MSLLNFLYFVLFAVVCWKVFKHWSPWGVANRIKETVVVDLGTRHIRAYSKKQGLFKFTKDGKKNNPHLLPTFVARRISNRKLIVAVGETAYGMQGREPDDVEVVQLIKLGCLHDEDALEAILAYVLTEMYPKAFPNGKFEKLEYPTDEQITILACVPRNANSAICKSVRFVVHERIGARARLILQQVVAGLGAKKRLKKSGSTQKLVDGVSDLGTLLQTVQILDIGAGTTDSAKLLNGEVVKKTTFSLPIGGDVMDKSIVDYFYRERNLIIEQEKAEFIKRKLGTLRRPRTLKPRGMRVTGKCRISGDAKTVTVTQVEIYKCLVEVCSLIADGVLIELRRNNSALLSDLREHGFLLTGGGSLIPGLRFFLAQRIKMKVLRARDPQMTVIVGAALVTQHNELLDKFEIKAELLKREYLDDPATVYAIVQKPKGKAALTQKQLGPVVAPEPIAQLAADASAEESTTWTPTVTTPQPARLQ